MLLPAFDFELNCEVPVGLVTIGKFDGKKPGLACATTGGRVVIHQPYINQVDDLNSTEAKKMLAKGAAK